jgi:pimeloyl-ACP methyl ester carboxylesterase
MTRVTPTPTLVPPERPSSPTSSVAFTRYRFATIQGRRVFYREAGSPDAPTIVLLHGFPSSSHMFRDLIPLLAGSFHVIAPDYIGFGYSDAPSVTDFAYTFDSLAAIVEGLLGTLGVRKAIFYMQDYGSPIGLRLATNNPDRVAGFVIQNGNAYLEGVGQPLRDVLLPFWKEWNDDTERAARGFLAAGTTQFLYTDGARAPEGLNPDAWTHDQAGLDRAGNDLVQLTLFRDYETNVSLYEAWHAFFRQHAPKTLIVWGANDSLFITDGAKAYLRDLPDAELHLLDGGHFVLEEYAPEVAGYIVRLFGSGAKNANAA